MADLDHFPATAQPQEAAALALQSLVARLDRDRAWRPYFRIDLGPPAHAVHDSWDYCDMAGRYVDAFVRIRQMTGSSPEGEAEEGLRRFLLARQNPGDSLFYNGEPGTEDYVADMFCQSRALLGLCAWAAETGDPRPRESAGKLAHGLSRIAHRRDNYAYYPSNLYRKGAWIEGGLFYEPKDLWSVKPGYGGTQLEALMAYHALTGDEAILPFVAEYLRYFLEAARVVAEDGSYSGHLHSHGILPTMVGAAMFAETTGDEGLLALCERCLRFTLDHCTPFGWVPDGIGWPTCETCALGDVIHLAIRLSRLEYGDFWPTVERFARNQLLENQFRDAERVLRGRDPEPGVAEIVRGSFASWARPNDLMAGPDLEGCCTGGGVRALHLVLGHTVLADAEGNVTAPMHFSVETEAASVRSALPDSVQVSVRLKRPATLRLRLPEGIAPEAVCVSLNGNAVETDVDGAYLRFERLSAGACVALTFPLEEHTEATEVAGTVYTVTWRGNTVTALEPVGSVYPTYRGGRTGTGAPSAAWPYPAQRHMLPW